MQKYAFRTHKKQQTTTGLKTVTVYADNKSEAILKAKKTLEKRCIKRGKTSPLKWIIYELRIKKKKLT